MKTEKNIDEIDETEIDPEIQAARELAEEMESYRQYARENRGEGLTFGDF